MDASAELVEATAVAWAWELELVDVDADFDLDVMLSSKVGESSALFRNDEGRLAHDAEGVWLGDEIAADTAPPKIEATRVDTSEAGELVVRARVHDDKSPSVPSDWDAVVLRTSVDGKAQPDVAMAWMGEFYWRVELPLAKKSFEWRVCATDAAGNETLAVSPTRGRASSCGRGRGRGPRRRSASAASW